MLYKIKLLIVFWLCTMLIACGDSKARQPLVVASLDDIVYVPGGTYTMGSDNPDFDEVPHPVELSPFYISKDNVSYKKYDLYTSAAGRTKIQKDMIGVFTRSDKHPVDNITWYQANDYCHYLAKITGLPYDLSTEAQWEYVARNNGKKNWDFPTDNGKQELGKNFPSFDQYKDQQKGILNGVGPLPVGSIPCTPQGVCGMSSAVNEWTKDWDGGSYPENTIPKDPQGSPTGTQKIIRGGGAAGSPEYNNSYGRAGIDPNKKWAGFRCVINSDKPMNELRAIAFKNLQ